MNHINIPEHVWPHVAIKNATRQANKVFHNYLRNRINEGKDFTEDSLARLTHNDRVWIEQCRQTYANRQEEKATQQMLAQMECKRQQEIARREGAIRGRQNRQLVQAHGFQTIKQALDAGFQVKKAWQYGGEQIPLNGKTLICNPKTGRSLTAWKQSGYRVKEGEQPFAERHFNPGRSVWYGVYRDDQVERDAEQ